MKKFVKNSFISTKFFIKDNTISIIFITLFTIGMLIGSLALHFTASKTDSLAEVLKQYFSENSTLSIMALFSRNIVAQFIYLVLLYMGGLSAIGYPIIAIIPIVKGIALGAIISYKYVYFGTKGFLYALLMILPANAILMAIFNFAFVESIYMSMSVSNGIFNGKPRNIKYSLNFITFTKRYLIFSAAMVFISILEAVIISLFSSVLS